MDSDTIGEACVCGGNSSSRPLKSSNRMNSSDSVEESAACSDCPWSWTFPGIAIAGTVDLGGGGSGFKKPLLHLPIEPAEDRISGTDEVLALGELDALLAGDRLGEGRGKSWSASSSVMAEDGDMGDNGEGGPPCCWSAARECGVVGVVGDTGVDGSWS